MIFFEVSINIPRVPALRLVYESLKEIAAYLILRAARIGFGGGKRLFIGALVEQAGHASGARIDSYADPFILERVSGCPQRR